MDIYNVFQGSVFWFIKDNSNLKRLIDADWRQTVDDFIWVLLSCLSPRVKQIHTFVNV